MVLQQVPTPTTWPDPTVEAHAREMTLEEAAAHLGLTEAEVLMRVFRGTLPSVVGADGCRRVLREALADEAGQEGGDVTAAEYEALAIELAEARARITALEHCERRRREESLADRVGALAAELAHTRERLAALEAAGAQARVA